MHTPFKLLTLASAIVLFAACGPSNDSGAELPGTPIEGVEGLSQTADGTFHDRGGRTCDDPTPCGDCDFDCKATGNPYRPGEPFDPTQDICGGLDVQLMEAIPTVVLLIDQSGSMDADFGNINRLDATYGALMDPTDGLVSSLQDRYRFGLALYTSYDGGPTCPNIRDVRPGFDNFDPINRVFEQAGPEEDTPTGEAIQGIMRMFDDEPVRGPKVILLATDGEPDTCAEPDPQNGQEESIAAAQQAHARGVETVVLSVGNEVSEQHLQHMANAGVGKATADIDKAPFFRADNPGALKSTMENIIIGSRECIFQIEGGILDPGLVHEGNIQVNGEKQAFGDNGWKFHMNEETCFGAKQCIELTGTACEAIQQGNANIGADWNCVYGDPDGDNGYGLPGLAGGPGGTGTTGTADGGTGTTGPGGDGSTGTGTGTTGTTGPGGTGTTGTANGRCLAASEVCSYDGDCCSGICGDFEGTSLCVVN